MTTVEDLPFTQPRNPQERAASLFDADAYALSVMLRSLIALGAATSARSTQLALGSSEAGHGCDRRIAYRLAGVPPVNLTDPLASLVGVGFHLAMAEVFRRLSGASGRYLVEQPVNYRGVPGTADLYDRLLGLVIDWKTTKKSSISKLRHGGPPPQYTVQGQLYAAGLEAAGESPTAVLLMFIPVDGTLADVWPWRAPYEKAIADNAIERVEQLRRRSPGEVPPRPDYLCPWCDHYRPGSTNLAVACPGNRPKETSRD